MERNRGNRDLTPRSFFRMPSFLPSLWEEMEGRMSQWMGGNEETGVSVSEDDQNVYVEAHLPGLSTQDIDISVHQNTLWVKGERKTEENDQEKKFYRRARNSFFYQVDLPAQIEENTEQADYQDGVLKITFKKTQQSQVRKIAVNQGKHQEETKTSSKSHSSQHPNSHTNK